MTPEQRIERTVKRLWPEGTIDHAINRERVARALRAERNAALEEAALVVDPERRGFSLAEAIRSLKSRAPRAGA